METSVDLLFQEHMIYCAGTMRGREGTYPEEKRRSSHCIYCCNWARGPGSDLIPVGINRNHCRLWTRALFLLKWCQYSSWFFSAVPLLQVPSLLAARNKLSPLVDAGTHPAAPCALCAWGTTEKEAKNLWNARWVCHARCGASLQRKFRAQASNNSFEKICA